VGGGAGWGWGRCILIFFAEILFSFTPLQMYVHNRLGNLVPNYDRHSSPSSLIKISTVDTFNAARLLVEKHNTHFTQDPILQNFYHAKNCKLVSFYALILVNNSSIVKYYIGSCKFNIIKSGFGLCTLLLTVLMKYFEGANIHLYTYNPEPLNSDL
jgi:hypothetical protein